LKEIIKGELDAREMKFIRDEIQIFTLISHPNAAKMVEVFENEKSIFIIMDLVNGGELFEFIVSQSQVEIRDVIRLLYHILEVIQYMQIASIVHRDLKPENILVTKNERGDNTIKIIDFGLSNILIPGTKMYEQCGTVVYAAPEVLKGEGYSTEVDIWSAGVIAHAMLTQKLPWPEYDDDQTEM